MQNGVIPSLPRWSIQFGTTHLTESTQQLLALFDLDNTLADRHGAFLKWAQLFQRTHRLPSSSIQWLLAADAQGVTPRDEFFALVRREFGLADNVDNLLMEYRPAYLRFYRCDPAVLVGLRHLRARGWRLGIVSNGPPSQVEKLYGTGLIDLVDGYCVSGLVGSAKPDIKIFQEAARRCGCDLVGWMVGDSPEADILGGANAGLRTIWTSRGRQWLHDSFHPDQIFDNVSLAISHLQSAQLT